MSASCGYCANDVAVVPNDVAVVPAFGLKIVDQNFVLGPNKSAFVQQWDLPCLPPQGTLERVVVPRKISS